MKRKREQGKTVRLGGLPHGGAPQGQPGSGQAPEPDDLAQGGETEHGAQQCSPSEVHQQNGLRRSHDCYINILLSIYQCSSQKYTSLEHLHHKDAGSKQSGKQKSDWGGGGGNEFLGWRKDREMGAASRLPELGNSLKFTTATYTSA